MLGSRHRRNPIDPPRRRTLRLLVVLALVAAAAGAAVLLPQRDRTALEGAPRVVDGDSLDFAGEAVRLKGIDAPELAQRCRRGAGDYPCGQEARRHLQALIDDARVACRLEGRDRYRRYLGVCAAGGEDLNLAMIRDGWAVGYRAHAALEREARGARRGLWAGTFERPQDWRKTVGASLLDIDEP
jgi:endonuclease YncB( thermonuclease family)